MTNELYLQHESLIKNTAYVISKKYNVEFEELFCQGNYIFCTTYLRCNCVDTFQPFLRKVLTQELHHYAKRLYKNSFDEISEHIPYKVNFEAVFINNEFLSTLSNESKEILDVIQEKLPTNKKTLRQELRFKNWNRRKINFHFYEIQEKLKKDYL